MSLLESSQKLQRTQPWPELNSGVSEDRGLRKSNEEVTIMENNLNIQPDSVSSVVEIKGQPNLLTLYNVPETNLSTTDEHFKITNKIEQHENEDISSGLIWTNGVATLSGSDLKFRMSATGDLEVISDTEETAVDQSPTATCWNENEEPVIPLITSGTVKNENQTGVDDHLNTENLAIISTIKSETTPDTPNASEIRTCSQCGYSGNSSTFLGAYCGKTCIARNARTHKRKISIVQPVNKRKSSSGKTGDLKIKIRLPSPNFANPEQQCQKLKLSNPEQINYVPIAEFSWEKYLEVCHAQAAPERLFRLVSGRDPIPNRSNAFEVGWLLEAIDPINQSLFCSMSVVCVRGHRIRLQYIGYKDCYDIWVNSDSPFIFPCGFCKRTGRQLLPPKEHDPKSFDWNNYVESNPNFSIAPEEVFASMPTSLTNLTNFEIKDKLEAIDRQNSELICVATVIDMLGDVVLIHFDGWDSEYDYWTRATSALIHPVGWCEENGRLLSLPQGYVGENFNWEQHLNETGFRAAPTQCFDCVPHEFVTGMKLEAVDPRNQSLVRVASVSEVEEHRLKIHFDGWDSIYDEWFDVDSSDLHPVNWCQKTGHPLEPQLTVKDRDQNKGGCPTPGCNGVGHVKSSKFQHNHRKHHSEYGCPYAPKNLGKAVLYDRLAHRAPRKYVRSASAVIRNPVDNLTPSITKKRGRRPRSDNKYYFPYNTGRKPSNEVSVSTQASSHYRKRQHHCRRHTHARKSLDSLTSSDQGYYQGLNSCLNRELPVCWEKNVRLLPGVDGVKAAQVKGWSIERVANFVNVLTGKEECGVLFSNEEVDGESLLLLTQEDISKVLKLKLGPAVKIYNAILMFKSVELSTDVH